MTHRLKPMRFGEVLDAAFLAFRDDLWLLCLVIGVVLFVPNLLMNLATPLLQGMVDQARPGDAATAVMLLVMSMVVLGVAMVVIVLGPFADAAAVKVVADRFLGRPTSLGAAYRLVFARFWDLAVAMLLTALAVAAAAVVGVLAAVVVATLFVLGGVGVSSLLGGSGAVAVPFGVAGGLLCVPVVMAPVIFVQAHLYAVAPAIMIEKVNGVQALGRSGRLMKGFRLKTCVLLIVSWAAVVAASALPGLVPLLWVKAPLQALLAVASMAFYQVLRTVVYLHLRCQKEGLDLIVAADGLAARAASATVPGQEPVAT